MDIENMTPEQLREYAANKEANKEALKALYYGDDTEQAPVIKHNPWERPVEVEGETYYVDMRRMNDEKSLRYIAELQKEAKGDDTPLALLLDYYEYLFHGSALDAIRAHVVANKGYNDGQEILRIESKIYEEVKGKN